MANIGKIRKIQNNLTEQRMERSLKDTDVLFSDDGLDELEKLLSDFEYVLRNLSLHEDRLEQEGFTALSDISKEMKSRDY